MVRKLPFKSISNILVASSIVLGCGDAKTPFHSHNVVSDPSGTPSADATADITKLFDSGKTKAVDLTIDSGFNNVVQSFALEQNPKQLELYHQIDRPQYTDSYTQGNKGIDAVQSFSVAEAGIFDLLLVIDNSSSMAPYQTRLSKTLPDILRHISNTNWRIAVVTTSTPCLQKTTGNKSYLSRADFDKDPVAANADFIKMISVGENGNPIERGIYMATQAMQETGCSTGDVGWLRPDSQRSVLLLSDENNCGSGSNEGCPGEPYESADYFFSKVGKAVTVNALLLTQEPPSVNARDPSDPNRDCENSGGYNDPPNPTQYYRLVNETGGRYVDICRSVYSSVLDQISQDIGTKVNVQFELASPAELSTLDVKLDGRAVSRFNINGKILTVLDPLTERSGTLVVKYKHDPVPFVKIFAPVRALDPSTIEVFVNGMPVATKDFQFNTATSKVELRDLPAESAEIKIRYRDNSVLPKVFTVLHESYLDTLEATVNELPYKTFSLDRATRRITLADAPRDGQSVMFSYELPGDRKTTYPMIGVLTDEIEGYVVVDAKTGATLQTTLDRGILKFDPADVSNGRKVEARYNLQHDFANKEFVIEAGKLPFPDTLKISADGDDAVCSGSVIQKDGKIRFKCSDDEFQKIRVTYQYADNYVNSFDASVNFSGSKTYRVFINGTESQDFHLLGEEVVILKKYLPPAAEVKVIVHPETN